MGRKPPKLSHTTGFKFQSGSVNLPHYSFCQGFGCLRGATVILVSLLLPLRRCIISPFQTPADLRHIYPISCACLYFLTLVHAVPHLVSSQISFPVDYPHFAFHPLYVSDVWRCAEQKMMRALNPVYDSHCVRSIRTFPHRIWELHNYRCGALN